MNDPSSPGRILAASVAALALAVLLLVSAILPAEYGWDPLGTGGALGLLGMARRQSTPLVAQDGAWRADDIEFHLGPFEAVEYKYRLEAGATLLYHWQAEGEVVYDLHAEPDGTAPGYAESFDRSRAASAAGSYTAPFSGIHGWFWQNRGDSEVRVRLVTRGYYRTAREFRDGRTFDYALDSDAAP